jgi:hypothetical protein
LQSLFGSGPDSSFGRAAYVPADVDRDGRLDVFVWTPGIDKLDIFSGRDLALLGTWNCPQNANHFGEALAPAGDVDGDGWGDVVIGAPTAAPPYGRAFVYSAVTGVQLLDFEGAWTGYLFGAAVAGGGDVDLDGYADVAVGAPRENLHGYSAGSVRIFAGGCFAPSPVSFCRSAPNSAGTEAHMAWEGTTSVALDDFALVVTGSVPGELGLFLMSDMRQELFGEGWRCVGQPFFRFALQQADAQGRAERAVDLDVPPARGRIVASSGWFFQWWYRDAAGGPNGFNASDGLAATFCP